MLLSDSVVQACLENVAVHLGVFVFADEGDGVVDGKHKLLKVFLVEEDFVLLVGSLLVGVVARDAFAFCDYDVAFASFCALYVYEIGAFACLHRFGEHRNASVFVVEIVWCHCS